MHEVASDMLLSPGPGMSLIWTWQRRPRALRVGETSVFLLVRPHPTAVLPSQNQTTSRFHCHQGRPACRCLVPVSPSVRSTSNGFALP